MCVGYSLDPSPLRSEVKKLFPRALWLLHKLTGSHPLVQMACKKIVRCVQLAEAVTTVGASLLPSGSEMAKTMVMNDKARLLSRSVSSTQNHSLRYGRAANASVGATEPLCTPKGDCRPVLPASRSAGASPR